MDKDNVELGDLAQDMITGYVGVAVAYAKHLTGCDRITLQAKADKDSKLPEAYGFDITTLKVLEKGHVKPQGRELPETPKERVAKAGGPPTREQRL